MGKPAARLGDVTAHGGAIVGPGCPTVLIGGVPAARLGDSHVCPMVNPGLPPPPHVGGAVALGSTGVLIGGAPAARMGDMCACGGPPATIAMGCPTVLIGETAGGGGGGAGGGGAGSGGGSGGAATASNLGIEIATYGGQPPEPEPDATHWIEFQFVDTAGLPVGGVPFEFTGTDGSKDRGMLQSRGTIRRDGIAAGRCTVKLFLLSNARWSKDEAKTDEEVQLTVDVEGLDTGTAARIVIYERDSDGTDDEIQTIDTTVRGGRIEARWKFRAAEGDEPSAAAESQGYSNPEYFFVAEAAGCRAVSGPLFLQDWIEIELRDDQDRPVRDEEYTLLLRDGSVRKGKLDAQGRAREDDIPPGRCRVEFKNHGSLDLVR